MPPQGITLSPPQGEQLIAAIKAGNITQVTALLKSGVDPNSRTGPSADKGFVGFDTGSHPTALMIAATEDHPDIVTLLIQYNARVNDKDTQGDSALKWAIYGKSPQSCQILIDHGADMEAMRPEKGTALSEAALHGDLEIIEMLLKKGAKVDAANAEGSTALMGAADVPIAERLLRNGANVNARDQRKLTALMSAVGSGEPRADMVLLLIKHKADVNAVSKFGETALGIARAHGQSHQAIVEILKRAGAKK